MSSFLGRGASAVQATTFGIFQKLPFVSGDTEIQKLKNDNLELLSQIAGSEKLKQENVALSDQFRTSYPRSLQLLQTQVIGAAAFLPGISIPNNFIIDKGLKDNLKAGMAVVIKDNLVGVVSQVSDSLSQVELVNNPSVSFTAKTQSGAVGVIKGGANLTIDNIFLSENIKSGELVLTKGSINSDGVGIPPDLVAGKIISVEKNPSNLFQKGKVESFVNFINLSTVFVYMQLK